MRTVRLTVPGMVHHIIIRFVDREWFFTDDEERERYISLLGRAIQGTDWLCLAYALMSNHIHIGMVAGEMPLESWARRVHPPFAHWMNARHARLGPLFAARPASWVIRGEGVSRMLAYIHNNPVRAGLVERARDSAWTSHRAYVGEARAPHWLALREGLRRAGCADASEFDKLVDDLRGVERNDPSLVEMRREMRRYGGLELGTPTLDPLEAPILSRPFARLRFAMPDVVAAASCILGISEAEMCAPTKQRLACAARRIAVHAGRQLGVCASDIAAVLGIDVRTASRLGLAPLEQTDRALVAAVISRVEEGRARFTKIESIEKASPE